MATIETVLWDIGGVLLTNGWDHKGRADVLAQFGVDKDAFEQRHPEANDAWEKGLITVEQYLDATVFYEPRSFTPAEFLAAMKAQSMVLPDSALGILDQLSASDSLVLGMLNNEAKELNDYRIEAFSLPMYFSVFLSSCYVGMRKPDEKIFRLALDVLQIDPATVAFIDDRPGNVAAANAVGMHGIHYTGSETLKGSLKSLGISVE